MSTYQPDRHSCCSEGTHNAGQESECYIQNEGEKSPGPDEITNEMLINLRTVGKSCMKGTVAQTWREEIIIPILKKGKCRTSASITYNKTKY